MTLRVISDQILKLSTPKEWFYIKRIKKKKKLSILGQQTSDESAIECFYFPFKSHGCTGTKCR